MSTILSTSFRNIPGYISHSFCTKSDLTISYHNRQEHIRVEDEGPDPEKKDKVMLIRRRLSRIFFLRKFFNYPISLNFQTIKTLGFLRVITIGFSYIWVSVFPIKKEESLEDFFINRFGKKLYETFFKHYTEKVWGMPCNKIPAEWGAQRIKGLSIRKAIVHALKSIANKDSSIEQKGTETSLIERFLYPKYGPGQMWEEVARTVESMGGEIHYGRKVVGLAFKDGKVTKVYKKSDGLPEDWIVSLAIDDNDVVWLNTLGGLTRYNGDSFVTYDEEDGLVRPRGNGDVSIDKNGNIVYSTYGSGLSIFDGKKFKNITTENGLVDGSFVNTWLKYALNDS